MDYSPEGVIEAVQDASPPTLPTVTSDTPQRARTWTWTVQQRLRSKRKAAVLRALLGPESPTRARLMASLDAAGVPYSTHLAWTERYPAYKTAILNGLAARETIIVDGFVALASRLNDPDKLDPKLATAAVKAGETIIRGDNPDKWAERQKIESTQTVNHIVQMSQEVRDTFRQRQLEKVRQIRTIDMPSNSDGKENDQ